MVVVTVEAATDTHTSPLVAGSPTPSEPPPGAEVDGVADATGCCMWDTVCASDGTDILTESQADKSLTYSIKQNVRTCVKTITSKHTPQKNKGKSQLKGEIIWGDYFNKFTTQKK
jgi:hypothetical protein